MNEQEKSLWINIYTQTLERTRGNNVDAVQAANQAVSDLRKSDERFDEE